MSEENVPMGFKEGTWYKCRVKAGASLRESRRSQTPYVGADLEVLVGPMFGEILKAELYLTPKTKDRALKALDLMGFQAVGASKDDWDNIGEKIEGAEIEVEPQVQEYKGKLQAKANNYRKVRTGDEPTLSETVAAMFGGSEFPTESDKKKSDEEEPPY